MEKILQFGEGNFLRAFAEHFIQIADDNGEDIGVAVCQPRTNTKIINALKAQNNEYNVYLRGRKDGKVVDDTVKITCVSRAIDSVGEYDKLEELFASDDLEMIISNTTEAGIKFDAADDNTFPAKLTRLVYKRYEANAKPLVFLPVELIEDNGSELKKCILGYAEVFGYDKGFTCYVEECSFCNTLVDRIVTGHIEGDTDPCSVACEPYASWIIEADEKAKTALSFARYSSEIVFCDDLKPYRERKVKILNGTHTMSVLAAYMAGFDIVRDMMNDGLFSTYIEKGLDEIKSTIDLDKSELDAFADAVKERFNNPFIDHKLLDIALNSVSKFNARCLPSIIDFYKANGILPVVLTFSFAALLAFYKHKCDRDYDVRDNERTLEFINNNSIFDILAGDILNVDLGFMKSDVMKYYDNIVSCGITEAIKKILQ